MRLPGANPISWFATGYTASPDWLVWLVNGVLIGVPAAACLWIAWRVFKSGPRPRRDAFLTWVTLCGSALCMGLAYPRDPEMVVPALICAALAVGCSVRVRKAGTPALFRVVVGAWVLWLPASAVLARALL